MEKSALAAFESQLKFDVVGPTVDDDVRRIISRYGATAVTDAVKRATKAKRGRRPEKDWPELRPTIDADAQSWLNGGDPFAERSNYSIAKDFADRNPGHSHPGTMKRVERKLVKQRVWMTLVVAYEMSRESYSYQAHLRTLDALVKNDGHSVWSSTRGNVLGYVADYTAKFGEAPASDLTARDVENATKNALLPSNALLTSDAKAMRRLHGGLFGAIAKRIDAAAD